MREFSLKLAITVGAVALVKLIWKLMAALILLFAASILAVALRSLARMLERITPLRGPWALAVATALLLIVLAAFFALIGWRIAAQIGPLTMAIESAVAKLSESLHASAAGQELLRVLSSVADSAPIHAATGMRAASASVGVLADIVLVVFIVCSWPRTQLPIGAACCGFCRRPCAGAYSTSSMLLPLPCVTG